MKALQVDRCASPGIVTGRAFVVKKAQISVEAYDFSDPQAEKNKFGAAVEAVAEGLKEAAKGSEIFAAHIDLVRDFALRDNVERLITAENKNAQVAAAESCDLFANMFLATDNALMRERAADLRDIRERLLMAMQGISVDPFGNMKEPGIVIAEDLSPSDTTSMNRSLVLGFATQSGGVTSHVAIIAKTLGLPALVGVAGLMESVFDGEQLILDADEGKLIISPDEATSQSYVARISESNRRHRELAKLKGLPAVTSDGVTVELYANVGNVNDILAAKEFGFDGIGLFRTEFLYMENTHFPTEEEQFTIYRQALLTAEKPVIIRTLDIGGDKNLPYYEFEKEENPFLGLRAIRLCFALPEVFKTQLRALLRASAFGTLRIMYPMIISAEELEKANAFLAECKKELDAERIPYDKNVEVGIMVETPAAVFCAPELARKVDFFSIGTNDLTQYITAVDRGNKRVAHLYDSKNPAVLRAIKQVIAAGHAAGIKVGMCGEFASDESAVPLLLGMGLDEFSMSAGRINWVKAQIRALSFADIQNSEAVKSI